MKHWEERAKGWVFLSHSSNDYENVKIVRDYLEENGFSALMFYLRCLEKDKKHLRKELIESEISERNIFVLCDSYDARKSDWVKWEKELVEKDKSKIFVTIDMENLKSEKCTELSKLDKLMKRSTLYFIYDYDDYKEYKNTTAKRKNIPNLSDKTKIALNETKNKGAVLVFLSQKILDQKWFWSEKESALEENTLIIPILLDDVDINEFPAFKNLKRININSEITIEEQITLIINENDAKDN
ncbi:TIR domain-containing protein [Arcobacter venerupis]|uniref:TIR domain-containing protein n=1 Tax=Arcobacter venerupis TaxID=1054033 RepID=A0AAE7BA21_9BACT|nr:TIR domain-containing protein [Arcobacter venerupis]QKF66557.1 TIR domain-containing protein [Arcobacter venerupis]RWS49706.1 hypothetical protein CKA56_08275 [Arcobacter venerupis]